MKICGDVLGKRTRSVHTTVVSFRQVRGVEYMVVSVDYTEDELTRRLQRFYEYIKTAAREDELTG